MGTALGPFRRFFPHQNSACRDTATRARQKFGASICALTHGINNGGAIFFPIGHFIAIGGSAPAAAQPSIVRVMARVPPPHVGR